MPSLEIFNSGLKDLGGRSIDLRMAEKGYSRVPAFPDSWEGGQQDQWDGFPGLSGELCSHGPQEAVSVRQWKQASSVKHRTNFQ